jgi:hypothetical protein
LELSALRALVGKPFLVSFSHSPSLWELECLRDVGVNAIVVDLEQTGPTAIPEVQARLEKLPRRKAKKEKPVAVVPRVTSPSRPLRKEEEEEEDEP